MDPNQIENKNSAAGIISFSVSMLNILAIFLSTPTTFGVKIGPSFYIWLPFSTSYLILFFPIIAIATGIIGVKTSGRKKLLAKIGLVLGILFLLLMPLIFIMSFSFL